MERDPQIGLNRLIVFQAIAAKKLLAVMKDPNEYTMNGKAEDANGNQVSPLSKEACRWSLLGSIYRARLSQEEALAAKFMFEMPQIPLATVSFGIKLDEARKILQGFAKDYGKKRQLYDDYMKLVMKKAAEAAPSKPQLPAPEPSSVGVASSVGGAETSSTLNSA